MGLLLTLVVNDEAKQAMSSQALGLFDALALVLLEDQEQFEEELKSTSVELEGLTTLPETVTT